MAVLEVLRFPDERLRTVAKPVDKVDDKLKKFIDDMLENMQDEKGIGLAETQVKKKIRLVVMDVSENQDNPLVFINPEFFAKEGSTISEEGCLSVPNNYAKVDRAEKVKVKALDR